MRALSCRGHLPRHTFCRFLVLTQPQCTHTPGQAGTNSTVVTMSFDKNLCQLILNLDEDGVFTRCDIQAIENDGDEEVGARFAQFSDEFRQKPSPCKCIVKSEQLKEALNELRDLNNATRLSVLLSPQAPHFQISAQGRSAVALQF